MKKDKLTYSFLSLRDKLHRSAMGFLRNVEDAKDVLQDTFFNLWQAGNIESDTEARNKLFCVLRNLCIDRLRKPKNFPIPESAVDSLIVEPTSGENLGSLERNLTKGLTDVQLRIYSYIIHDGMEYEDIATILGTTVEAVRMNMSRARKKIRDNLKNLNQ